MTQLERDLELAIDTRLHRWVEDSYDLFDMAEIRNSAPKSIIKCLGRALGSGLVEFGADDEYMFKLIQAFMTRAKAAKARLANPS